MYSAYPSLDEERNVVRAAFSPVWPLEILNTLTLTEHEGQTTLTLRGVPIDATDEERAEFEAMRGSMEQGFGETFDQLANYLASGL
ncbi:MULTISPECIES: SRPBCC domain-containing protein [Paenibacillus]|uniref:SRPBCC domain-containing protein n=1 Tax=Paenibacillus TaxID=44249 RepID=UPI0022B863A3|nr:SRPBCC domain-containing protein [Paenibacillus caseinilyticus]MCZ8521169.1 SRPBCC domain-containing protein [Paenibacillus caseinilyticus]